ncbi:MAG: hypothetical protein JXA14_24575 [Anaerolineae bacterium]|nr:hypothetical protein [Anaerolineae bacterium]
MKEKKNASSRTSKEQWLAALTALSKAYDTYAKSQWAVRETVERLLNLRAVTVPGKDGAMIEERITLRLIESESLRLLGRHISRSTLGEAHAAWKLRQGLSQEQREKTANLSPSHFSVAAAGCNSKHKKVDALLSAAAEVLTVEDLKRELRDEKTDTEPKWRQMDCVHVEVKANADKIVFYAGSRFSLGGICVIADVETVLKELMAHGYLKRQDLSLVGKTKVNPLVRITNPRAEQQLACRNQPSYRAAAARSSSWISLRSQSGRSTTA